MDGCRLSTKTMFFSHYKHFPWPNNLHNYNLVLLQSPQLTHHNQMLILCPHPTVGHNGCVQLLASMEYPAIKIFHTFRSMF